MTITLMPSRVEERTKTDNCLIKVIPDVVYLSDIYNDLIGVLSTTGEITEFNLDATDLYLYHENFEIRVRRKGKI